MDSRVLGAPSGVLLYFLFGIFKGAFLGGVWGALGVILGSPNDPIIIENCVRNEVFSEMLSE